MADPEARLSGLRRRAGPAPLLVRYGPEPPQFAELWPAAGKGAAPVVALLHGGYWRDRYRLDVMNRLAAALAPQAAVWNLEYRRVGSGGGWPATFEDVAAGFDALVEVASAHRLDLDRVGVAGHSAGGQLALWIASRARLEGGPGHRPRLGPGLAVSLAGVCDPVMAARLHLSQDAVVDFLGGTPEEAPEVYRHAAAGTRLPLGLPQLLVHGTADDSVPIKLSEDYHRAAVAAGDRCRLLRLEGADHFDLIDPESDPGRRVVELIVEGLSSL